MDNVQIAIDGPVGAGKSLIARMVAKRLGILYLDTGAMYRAIGLTALKRGVSPGDEAAVAALCGKLKLEVELSESGQKVIIDGEDVTDDLRTVEVTRAASFVSQYAGVREAMVAIQREIARSHGVVMEGRDIASYVLPDAKYKFFLTATVEERANRRYKEMRQNGMEAELEAVKRDILERDTRDMTRSNMPLRHAPDAILLDTTGLMPDEVVERITERVRWGI